MVAISGFNQCSERCIHFPVLRPKNITKMAMEERCVYLQCTTPVSVLCAIIQFTSFEQGLEVETHKETETQTSSHW